MAVEDNGNPFTDESLTNHPWVEAQPADGNPFADPALTSPEATQSATPKNYSGFAMGSKVPNSILNAPDSAGEAIAGLTAAGVAGIAASPIVDAAISHLGGLTAIVEAARKLGWTTFGIKEAHDVYKMVTGDKK
jgi:hypothetical protein